MRLTGKVPEGKLVSEEEFAENRDKARKQRSSRAELSCKSVDLDLLQKRLFTILWRDTAHLMDAGFNGKLNEKDSQGLVNYIKLLKDLKRMEDKESEGLSDEELEKIAKEENGPEDSQEDS